MAASILTGRPTASLDTVESTWLAAGVMDRLPSFWQLENFVERLDAWIANEKSERRPAGSLSPSGWSPASTIRIPTLTESRTFPNLWFGPIPETQHSGQVVVCSY